MLTYELKKQPGVPLYEALYRSIRADILSGALSPGQKLPSKRALAANLEVSKITVETAYAQLLAEGYLRSEEKVGFFVEAAERAAAQPQPSRPQPREKTWELDLTANGCPDFPFSVWSRLQRQVLLEEQHRLLLPLPHQGAWELRQAIAAHLAGFRGMTVGPENILIGAGTDFLYNLLVQLLGRDKIYAVEEPGYGKIRRLYAAAGARCVDALMDSRGVRVEALGEAQVLHISPSHHFPTGLITPLSRRQQLLSWAAEEADRYIIEDDYDSEFRFNAHPMPTVASLDRSGRVIYMNTFSKTLAPSIRVGFMVLPDALMERFVKELGFYSCTVPSFEQYTLERFLRLGYFEKHINRMRKAYKARRDRLMQALQGLPVTVLEQDAGLHFLLQVDTALPENALVETLGAMGIRVRTLASYYHGPTPQGQPCLVINYSALTEEKLTLLEQKLLDFHTPKASL